MLFVFTPWRATSKARSRAGEVEESSSHTEHGQSVYLALCSVGTPSSRLFHGPPYLSHALLLPPPLPPVHMPSLGSLQAHIHTHTHTHHFLHMDEHIPKLQEHVDTCAELWDKNYSCWSRGLMSGRNLLAGTLVTSKSLVYKCGVLRLFSDWMKES